MLYRLREFSDNTSTVLGYLVELNELYSADELLTVLQDPTNESKLIWGWNPNIVKYIGGNIGDLNENDIQIKILKSLNYDNLFKFKQQKVSKAQKLIIRYLRAVKTSE